MKINLLLTILAVTVTAVAGYSVQNQTAQPASHNQDSQTKKSDSQPQPTPTLKTKTNVPLQPPSAEERNKSVRNDDPEPDGWARISDILIAMGTIALAIIGGVGTCAAIKTLKALVRQTAAAEIAAKAAKKSADLAETTMRIIDAPDLFLDNAGLIPNGRIIPNSYVALKVKNFGGSRAKNVRSFIKLIIPEVPECELSPETFAIGRGGTQLVRFLTFKETVNRETFDKIVRGEILVRFSGDIVYDDSFGESYVLNCRGVLNAETGTFALGDKDPKER